VMLHEGLRAVAAVAPAMFATQRLCLLDEVEPEDLAPQWPRVRTTSRS
jgi:hypothetical protein